MTHHFPAIDKFIWLSMFSQLYGSIQSTASPDPKTSKEINTYTLFFIKTTSILLWNFFNKKKIYSFYWHNLLLSDEKDDQLFLLQWFNNRYAYVYQQNSVPHVCENGCHNNGRGWLRGNINNIHFIYRYFKEVTMQTGSDVSFANEPALRANSL